MNFCMRRLFLLVLSAAACNSLVRQPLLSEPARSDYFATTIPRLQNPSWAQLQPLLSRGQPVIIQDAVPDWPLVNASCASFKARFPTATARAEYDDIDERTIRLGQHGDDWHWDQISRKVGRSVVHGVPKQHVPVSAPYIWHAKHFKQQLQSALQWLPRPTWLPENERENWLQMNRTVEFWFALGGGGAMAHADGHCGTIVSVQLHGTKRWRLMPLPQLHGSLYKFDEADGGAYRANRWAPLYDVEIQPGEALLFPSSMMHETRATSPADECGSSVSFQLAEPPGRMLHALLPSLLLSQEVARCVDQWAPMVGLTRPGLTSLPEMSSVNVSADALLSKVDISADSKLDETEVLTFLSKQGYGPLAARGAIAFHDVNSDGLIDRQELRYGLARWIAALSRLKSVLQLVDEEGLTQVQRRSLKLIDKRFEADLGKVPTLEESRRFGNGKSGSVRFEGVSDGLAMFGGYQHDEDPKDVYIHGGRGRRRDEL